MIAPGWTFEQWDTLCLCGHAWPQHFPEWPKGRVTAKTASPEVTTGGCSMVCACEAMVIPYSESETFTTLFEMEG